MPTSSLPAQAGDNKRLASRYAAEALAKTPCPPWCITDHGGDEVEEGIFFHDSTNLAQAPLSARGERVQVVAQVSYDRAGVVGRMVDVFAEGPLSLGEAQVLAEDVRRACALLEAHAVLPGGAGAGDRPMSAASRAEDCSGETNVCHACLLEHPGGAGGAFCEAAGEAADDVDCARCGGPILRSTAESFGGMCEACALAGEAAGDE